jgi:hypothetical protein
MTKADEFLYMKGSDYEQQQAAFQNKSNPNGSDLISQAISKESELPGHITPRSTVPLRNRNHNQTMSMLQANNGSNQGFDQEQGPVPFLQY